MTKCILIVAVNAFLSTLTLAAATFHGNFLISNLIVDSPSEINKTSIGDSYVCFDFEDQDTPQTAAAHCIIDWTTGRTPSTGTASCDNSSYHVSISDSTYNGVADFALALSHKYVDDSVGQWPYNMLTKYGSIALTYPKTVDYVCDTAHARCESCEGAKLTAVVTSAVA